MNFQEFLSMATDHLVEAGWVNVSHNGVWSVHSKEARYEKERFPLPAALSAELQENGAFGPVVEEYLLSNGWRRSSTGVSAGQPSFQLDGVVKPLGMAMLEQLKLQRLNNEDVAPRATPNSMRKLLDVTELRARAARG